MGFSRKEERYWECNKADETEVDDERDPEQMRWTEGSKEQGNTGTIPWEQAMIQTIKWGG